MIAKPAVLLLSCAIGFYGIAPSWADESRLPDPGKAPAAASDAGKGTAATATAAAPTATSPATKQHSGFVAGAAGAFAETPAAICRQSKREIKNGVKDFTNNSSSPLLRVPAVIVSVPFGIAAGCVEGTIYAFRYRKHDNAPDNMKKMSTGVTD